MAYEDVEDWSELDQYTNTKEREIDVTERLGVLFPAIDKDGDGRLSLGELSLWEATLAEKINKYARLPANFNVHFAHTFKQSSIGKR